MLEDILKFNKEFVQNRGYEKYLTNKYPDKKIAIISCMDTRLLELIPAALGLKNGDVKMIKNAGGVISHPFGSAVRSLLIAIYELGVEQVMVIGHTDCGAPVGNLLFRCIGGDCDGILRSDYVYRSGCSPSLPGYISYIRPSDTDACHIAGRGFVGVGVQPHSTYAGI